MTIISEYYKVWTNKRFAVMMLVDPAVYIQGLLVDGPVPGNFLANAKTYQLITIRSPQIL
jgi:hypothetical protein